MQRRLPRKPRIGLQASSLGDDISVRQTLCSKEQTRTTQAAQAAQAAQAEPTPLACASPRAGN